MILYCQSFHVLMRFNDAPLDVEGKNSTGLNYKGKNIMNILFIGGMETVEKMTRESLKTLHQGGIELV